MSFDGLSELHKDLHNGTLINTEASSCLTANTIYELADANITIDGDKYTSQELKSMFKVLKEMASQKYPEDFI